jgi:hypothetical protein
MDSLGDSENVHSLATSGGWNILLQFFCETNKTNDTSYVFQERIPFQNR